MKRRKHTLKDLQKQAQDFLAINKLKDLSLLTETVTKDIVLLSIEPTYYHFKVLKKGDKYRQIEAPTYALKKWQQKLNHFLQAVYYETKPTSSYGFIVKPLGEKNPKNIYTNALQHLHHAYMLHIDFKDFFHQITTHDVLNIFKNPPFNFDKHLAHLLSKITTYKGRLPMGAPTSPVLSNLFIMELDKEINLWAQLHNATYTRYVDDLNFSSNTTQFTAQHFTSIAKMSARHSLYFNQEKTQFFNKTDIKKVNGLVLNKTVDIDPEYYQLLEDDISRLKTLNEIQFFTGNQYKNEVLKKFKQEVMGKVNFIGMIEGRDSNQFKGFLNKYLEAIEPPEEHLIRRWTKFSTYS